MQELVMTYQKIEVARRSPHLGAFIEAVELFAAATRVTIQNRPLMKNHE
jgi:hypothetical protein